MSYFIELLAPAKDLECGLAALDCGADAVYIGAERFSAREAAGNSLETIETLINYAHKYWAKVYVALNTLLKDEELPAAQKLIQDVYQAGADGLIIQDLGLLELDLPPIPITASTQMHNNTLEKIIFLEKVGFSRVILPRESSLKEIQAVRSKTNLDLECFVHGALCVSYSGQCYLSYALGGRSGNRGQCAQPCRLPYTLVDSKDNKIISNKHLLSLKDLNLSAYLTELIQAGVNSFKIEGRLKDVGYIKNIVSYYRQQIDQVLANTSISRTSSGYSEIKFTPNPNKTFNRSYTEYFVQGRPENLASFNTPKSIGEYLGKIINLTDKYLEIGSTLEMHNGDGLCYFDKNGELKGFRLDRVDGHKLYPNNIHGLETGLEIYRNLDAGFIKELKAPITRKIPVKVVFSATKEGFELRLTDQDNIQVQVYFSAKKEIAKNQAQALETIKKQLNKTGDTEFSCKEITLDLPEAYFIPVAELNSLRRKGLAALTQKRAESFYRSNKIIKKNNYPYPEQSLSYQANVLNQKAQAFYRRHGVTNIEPAAESGLDLQGQKVMTTKYCLKHELGYCPKHSKQQTTPNEPWFLINKKGNRLKLKTDCALCQNEFYF